MCQSQRFLRLSVSLEAGLGLKGDEKPAGRRLQRAQRAPDFAFLASLGLPLLLTGCHSECHLSVGKKKEQQLVLSYELVITDSHTKANMSSAFYNRDKITNHTYREKKGPSR